MTRWAVIFLIAFAAPRGFSVEPEDCLARNGKAVASLEHNGKTYRFTAIECRDQFLTDPERYSQLYDALEEMAAAGFAIESEAETSLVPS